MKMESMYEQLGVSAAIYEYGERIIAELRDRFDAIDQTAEYNQAKVLSAMQKNRVNATHFAATTGYGYDDEGLRFLISPNIQSIPNILKAISNCIKVAKMGSSIMIFYFNF